MAEVARWLLAVLAAALTASPGGAQSASDLRVGHWIKVKGALRDDGVFAGVEVEVLAPQDDQSLTGSVSSMRTPTRFLLLGQEVHVSQRTQWRGLAPGDLVGARVKVEGDYRGPRNFSANTIARRDPGRDALEGRVDRIARKDDAVELTVMHLRVTLPAEAELTSAQALDQMALAPERVFASAEQVRDDDDEVRGSLALGDVTLGGQIEYKHDTRLEQDLDRARNDDRTDRQTSLRVEAAWEPSEHFFALGSARWLEVRRIDQDDADVYDTRVLWNEGYGYWRDALGLGWDVQVGRQDFDERREWLYDQNLDGLRLIRSLADVRVELSATTTLSDGNARDEHATNWIAYVSNNDLDRHLAAYLIDREDDRNDDRAAYLGVRALGSWVPRNEAWVDVAWLSGETSNDALSSFGLDLGTTWTPWDDGPWLVGGFAYGAGGRDARQTFRQTGLNDNTDKFGGVSTFQYYGELFDPELSNLAIATLGVGWRPTRSTSLDLVAHRYQQAETLPSAPNTGLRRKPDGVHSVLGHEVDAVFGARVFEDWLFELSVGWFTPGDAYPGADDAWLAHVQLRYKF